ncbi:MAG: DUF4491 family protein [Clostridium fessum]
MCLPFSDWIVPSIVIYAEYYFGSRCWPVFLLVGILCMILSVRMQKYFGRFPWVFWASVALEH